MQTLLKQSPLPTEFSQFRDLVGERSSRSSGVWLARAASPDSIETVRVPTQAGPSPDDIETVRPPALTR